MIRSALAIIFLMFLFLSDFANAQAVGEVTEIPLSEFKNTEPLIPFSGQIDSSNPEVQAILDPANKAALACNSRYKLARGLCLESLNPNIGTAMAVVGGLTSAVTGLGIMDTCSKYANILDVAGKAMAAFNTGCTAAKYACDTGCATASKAYESAAAQLASGKAKHVKIQTSCAEAVPVGAVCVANETKQIADYEWAEEVLKNVKNPTIAKIVLTCEKYKYNLMAAGAGMTQILSQTGLSKKCEENASVDCNANPTDATCVANVDCTIAANATKTTCICAKSPTTAGCAGAGLAGGTEAYQQTNAGSLDSDPKTSANLNATGTADVISPSGNSESMAGGALGGPAGAGGGGGIAGGSAQNKGGKTADGKALNTNILSGYEGGGGGGGSRSGSGSSELDQYLPGGKKDPSRNVASQVYANGQVTGGGGKSNWEKVTDRYRDNRPKLMTGP